MTAAENPPAMSGGFSTALSVKFLHKNMPGLQFKKIDLHLHTPASKDFNDKTVTPEQLVRAAIDKGLDAIAVTDHNTAEWVDRVKDAAKGKPLVVFPGVEITCNGGKSGLHLIALFDPTKDKRHVDALLSKLDLKPEDHGDLNKIVSKDPTELAAIAKGCDAIAVLAHINSSQGAFVEMEGQGRIGLMNCENIGAAEATDFQDEERAKKKKRACDLLDGTDQHYKRKLAVYQASDNPGPKDGQHCLEGIGSRCAYFKMETVNLDALRQCFNDPDVRIKQDFELQKISYPKIESVSVTGGYLDGATVDFHEGLNSVLGGKGSGKSLLVELMRFGLNQESSIGSIREDHEGKLESKLLEYGRVELKIVDSAGRKQTITREYRSGEGSPYIPELGFDPAQYFPVLFLSQNEIISIAEDEKAQLDFIDKFFDFRLHKQRISDLEKKIESLDAGLGDSIRAVQEQRQIEKDVGLLDQEVKKIDASLQSKIFEKFTKAEAKKNSFEGQLEFLDDREEHGKTVLQSLQGLLPPELPSAIEADPALKRNRAVLTKLLEDLRVSHEENLVLFRDSKLVLQKEFDAWKPDWKMIENNYQDFVRKSGGDYKVLAQDRAKKVIRLEELKKGLLLVKARASRLKEVAQERTDYLAKLKGVHEEYSKERMEKCSNLETQSSGRLQIKITESSNTLEFKNKLSALKKGSYLKDAEIEKISGTVDPTTFVSCLLNYLVQSDPSRLQPIVSKSGIEEERVIALATFLLSNYSPEELLSLQYKALPQDRPEILLNVGVGGQPSLFQPLNKLSVGQKCAAMLIIALSEGEMPVIIDQPEDSLDIRSIWDDVCSKVRNGKEKRQFAFTTHNSSLAVASDTDSFTILEADATKARVVYSGSMDHDPVNSEVMKYLEGGVSTYKMKFGKYRSTGNSI